MRKNSTLYQQALEINIAIKLIRLGARLVVLTSELNISREKLIILYKEFNGGDSPVKGMLPSSIDWFMTWQPCVHSSLFMAYYKFFEANTTLSGVELLVRAYEMYLEEVSRHRNHDKENPILSITRAWIMLRMIKADHPLIVLTTCKICGGSFISRSEQIKEFYDGYVCGFCNKPIRAGKTERHAFV